MKKLSEKLGLTVKFIFADYDLDDYLYDLKSGCSNEANFEFEEKAPTHPFCAGDSRIRGRRS